MRLKIKVSPDGKEATGLYSDLFPWKSLGGLEIKRASDVFFSLRDQKWGVRVLGGNKPDKILPQRFDKRKDAIEYEIAYLQGQL